MRVSKRRQSKDGHIEVEAAVTSLTFERALEVFLQGQDAAAHSKVTHKDYQTVIGLFIRYVGDSHHYTSVEQVTEADIFGWLAHLRNSTSRRGRPYSTRTIETYHRDVAAFFCWLVQHKHLTVNPMAQVKRTKVEKPLIRVFTNEELVLLDAACDRKKAEGAVTGDERKALGARDRAILWILLSTGIRRAEVCGLLLRDIEWDTNMVYVRGKGAKERKVPMGKVARQHLTTYIQYWRGSSTDTDEHVFLNLWGRPLNVRVIQNIFVRLKKVAGITDKRVSAHTCRHWFAVNCIKRGMPSTVLQGLLGHEELEMINTYVRLAEQDNREIYARYSPVDALEMHHTAKGRREQMREWRANRKGSDKA